MFICCLCFTLQEILQQRTWFMLSVWKGRTCHWYKSITIFYPSFLPCLSSYLLHAGSHLPLPSESEWNRSWLWISTQYRFRLQFDWFPQPASVTFISSLVDFQMLVFTKFLGSSSVWFIRGSDISYLQPLLHSTSLSSCSPLNSVFF